MNEFAVNSAVYLIYPTKHDKSIMYVVVKNSGNTVTLGNICDDKLIEADKDTVQPFTGRYNMLTGHIYDSRYM